MKRFRSAEATGFLECQFASGTESETFLQARIRLGEGAIGWAAGNRRSLVNARPSADLAAAGLDVCTALQSALACPLVFNERTVGVLAVYHAGAAYYSDDHRRLLDTVSDLAVAGIQNSIIFERAMEDVLTDPLTGLPNERFLFMHIARELPRAERLGAQVAILVLDLGDFQRIKIDQGRVVGEQVLREVARVLRARLRPFDLCVRYREDEFILVFPGVGPGEAGRVAAELRGAVAGVHVEAPGGRLTIGAGVGAAVFPDDGASFEAVLAVADDRLRSDKARRPEGPGSVRL